MSTTGHQYGTRAGTMGVLCAVLCLGTVSGARAQSSPATGTVAADANATEPGLRWEPHWPRFRTWEYGLVATLVASQLYLEFGPGTAAGAPRVKGLLPLDDGARDLVLLHSQRAQIDIDHASDFTWYGTLLFPLYADAVAAAWIGHGSGDVAWQLSMISIQVALSVSILTRMCHLIVQRQRPLFYYGEREGVRPDIDTAESLSFFSGHAALAFAGAGLTCRFHQHLSLFGAAWADTTACIGTLVTATATGLFRMMSDRHFLSDTLVAAAVGLSAGYYLPALLHFRDAPGPERAVVTPWATTDSAGVAWVGTW